MEAKVLEVLHNKLYPDLEKLTNERVYYNCKIKE